MEAGHLCEKPANSSTARNTSSNHLRLQRLMRLLLAANNQATRRNEIIKKLPSNWVQAATDMHPRLPQQETKSSTKQLPPTDPILGPENLLKTGFAQKGPPSCPSGRHKHKASLKPKRCASATLIQQTSKNEPKHGPKNGTAWRSHFGTECTA